VPLGDSQISSRRNTPIRMSIARQKSTILLVMRSNGSSSTTSRMRDPSVAFTTVWPVRASPNASSGYTIGHVSWKPSRITPGSREGVPSSGVPRMPRYPLPTAKTDSSAPSRSGTSRRSTISHSSTG
jgi:hypothetical protein